MKGHPMAARGTIEALAYLVGRGRPAWQAWPNQLWRFARRKPLGAFGALVTLAIIVVAILAPAIAPYDVQQTFTGTPLAGASRDHLFGVDDLGRDVLSRVVFGARVSVYVGFGAVAISVLLSTLIGVISGYYGGRLDTTLQRLVDIWLSFPVLVLIITIISVAGQGLNQVTLVLGILLAAGSSRVIRSAVIAIRHNQYIEAAHVVGANDPRIIGLYILPNIAATIIVLATVQLGVAILAEAAISFLGWGIPPPTPSWGQMLSGSVLTYAQQAPHLAIWPGVAILLTVFSFNVLGDALRDVLDPRLRGV